MEIKFKKNEIIISIILCVSGLFLNSFLLFKCHSYQIPVCLLWIIVIIFVGYLRLNQLNKCRKGIFALKIDKQGITNNTQLRPIFITWNEIKEFQTEFYRTRSIYIEPQNPQKFTVKKILGLHWNNKNSLLWIDTDMLEIKIAKLLELLKNSLIEAQC